VNCAKQGERAEAPSVESRRPVSGNGATGPLTREALCRGALTQSVEGFGAASHELANYLYILGAARRQQGDRKDARRYFQQAFELAGNASAEGRVRQGPILVNFAGLSALEKQWLQAKDSLLQALALMEPLLGRSHTRT
jgi:tetratricopeptide (TPR) repeat protein